MTSVERMYEIHRSMLYIAKRGIPGDIVECGVWRGGSLMMSAYALMAAGDTSRRLIACDTFEGHPRPEDKIDIDVWGRDMAAVHDQLTAKGETWGKVEESEVRANLESTGYPKDKIVTIKGMVEDTLPTDRIDKIALLRLDTDWYRSTRHILDHLYPKVSYGGLVVVDDYGHLEGSRKATDEYFAKCEDLIYFMHIDYSCIAGVKYPPLARR
jgi:hypothetical protein